MNGKLNLFDAKETRHSSNTNHIASHNMLLRTISIKRNEKQTKTNELDHEK